MYYIPLPHHRWRQTLKRGAAGLLTATLCFSAVPWSAALEAASPVPALLTAAAAEGRITVADGMVDNVAPAFRWSEGWATQEHPTRFGKTYAGTVQAGAWCEIDFHGQGIQVITARHAGAGAYDAYVDGHYVGSSTMVSSGVQEQVPGFELWGLEDGDHTVKLVAVGPIEVDGAQVLTQAPEGVIPPTIESQPADAAASDGSSALFTLSASGEHLFYQWQEEGSDGWNDLEDANKPTYTTPLLTTADSGARFRCVVTSFTDCSAIRSVSRPALLTVEESTGSAAPVITAQPGDLSVHAPQAASFSLTATAPDNGTLSYRWQVEEKGNWTDLEGAVSSDYRTGATALDQSGRRFRCVVTNRKGDHPPVQTVSLPVTMTVTAPDHRTIALDRETGRLSVDYQHYLSRHDVVFRSPILEGPNGSTVGTGRLGAMVWNGGGLKLEVTNVDAAPYSSIPSGLITYRSAPMPTPVEGQFEQRLNLYEGTVTSDYGDGLHFTVMGDPDSELMGLHIKDDRTDVEEVSVDLSLWLDKLNADPDAPFTERPYGNPSVPFPNQETWLNPEFTVQDDFVAITRGAEDPNHFGHSIGLTVEGAEFSTQLVGEGNDRRLRLTIDPADKEYTVWIMNPSRRHAQGHDTMAALEQMKEKLAGESYQQVYDRFTAFWAAFWSRCFVEYQSPSNPDVDYLENSWYLYQYLFGCGSLGEFPFHFMNGVWHGTEQDESLWSWDYTSFNERTFAYTHYATNRLELTDSYYDLFINNLEAGEQYTIDRFWINDRDERFNPDRPGYIPGGVLSPERHTWDGKLQVGYNGTAKGCPYTTKVNATAAEHALGMFERYKWSGDVTYLEQKAYPFMRAVGIYLLNFLRYDEATDTYYSSDSNALEQYWGVTNPINDLAAFPALLEKLIEASNTLNVDAELRALWQERMEKLARPKTEEASVQAARLSGGSLRYQPHDPPRTSEMNSQNPELDVVWPYNRVGLHQEGLSGFDFPTAMNSYLDRKRPLNIWTPEPIVAARLGMGDESFKQTIAMIARSQTRPNGIHYDGNGMFESNALMVTAVNEELLQSYNDKIAVFPAVISDPEFHSRFTLLARGGFLVSSEYADGDVLYISLISQLGGRATVINPWGQGNQVRITDLSSNSTLLESDAEELSFDTVKGGRYLVELVGWELDPRKDSAEIITAEPNRGQKSLSAGRRVLGSKGSDPIRYLTAEDGMVTESHPAFRYKGSWHGPDYAVDRFDQYFMWTLTAGDSVDLYFTGTGLTFYSTQRTDGSSFTVELDGKQVLEGSLKGQVVTKKEAFTLTGLKNTDHKVTIRNAAGVLEVDAAQAFADEQTSQAAQQVMDLIDAIGTVTLDSEEAVAAARTAYDALSEEEQTLVTNLEALTAAEEKLAQLKAEAQAEIDRKAAARTDALIEAIGTVTRDSGAAIHAARLSYNNLTGAQQKLVTKLDVLLAAEKAFAELNRPVEFPDVKPRDWFYSGVQYSARRGYISGLPDGTFGPAVTMTRAQLVQMLYALEGKPAVEAVTDKFSDVRAGDWFADAVTWAVEHGVTGGVGEGKFAPNAKITRQEMAVMLYAYKGSPAVEGELSFDDSAAIADWAAKAVVWAVDNGLMSSVSTAQPLFSPKSTATRAEAAIILMNLDKLAG